MTCGSQRDARTTALARFLVVLSQVFLEPEADIQEELRALARDLPETLKASVHSMIRSHEDGKPLSEEYIRLFLHGNGGRTVHLYESVYRSGKIMDTDVLSSLRRLYEEAEIRPRPNLSLPPDHLSLELDCLAHCLVRMQEDQGSACSWEHLIRVLLAEHLRPFAQALCARLEESAPRTYYLHAAQALSVALQYCHEKVLGAQESASGQRISRVQAASSVPLQGNR
jgi:TorA maturation chaperone TorD